MKDHETDCNASFRVDPTFIQYHRPRLFSLPGPFFKNLANLILEFCRTQDLLFSDLIIFLPYQRAIPYLQNALVRAGLRGPIPKIQTIEMPFGYSDSPFQEKPTVSMIGLKGALFGLIKKHQKNAMTPFQMNALCERLLETGQQIALHEADLDRLDDLIPENFSHHFQKSLMFLKHLTQLSLWKQYQEQVVNCDKVIDRWRQSVPKEWILAAGSGASLPLSQRLLSQISQMERGMVIFHLCRLNTDHKVDNPFHPLLTIEKFCQSLGKSLEHIFPLIQGTDEEKARVFLSSYQEEAPPLAASHSPFDLMVCSTLDEEALSIALILKKSTKQSLFVTADRMLAQTVQMHLFRMGINVQIPRPLSQTIQAGLMILLGHVWQNPFCPLAALDLFKHPLIFGANKRIDQWVRRFEKGISGLYLGQFPQNLGPSIKKIWNLYQQKISPLIRLSCRTQTLCQWIDTHIQTVDFFAPGCLLSENGILISEMMQQWRQNHRFFAKLSLEEYVLLWQSITEQKNIPVPVDPNAPINILFPLEARLLSAEHIILGGLSEGSWPHFDSPDPWLNTTMKKTIGLPDDGWQIGLSARDFMGLLMAPHVTLTRHEQKKGEPLLPSRFWLRIENAKGVHLKRINPPQWPDQSLNRLPYAKPCPDLLARPKRFSSSDATLLIRDPYTFYIQRILKIIPNQPPSFIMDKRQIGIEIHQLLHDFFRLNQKNDDSQNFTLFSLAEKKWNNLGFFQKKQFKDLLLCFESFQKNLATNYKTFTETWGAGPFQTSDLFQWVAKADRLDQYPDGRVRLIDYKTGQTPTRSVILSGNHPQMLIESFLILSGGFSCLKNPPILESVEFWNLRCPLKAGEVIDLQWDKDLWEKALTKVEEKIISFSDEKISYSFTNDPPDPDIALLSRSFSCL